MKRKLIFVLAILAIALVFVGCTKKEAQTTTADSKVLVVYYTLTGSTETLAKTIAEKTNATLFKLEPVTPYVSETVSEEKQIEIDNNSIRDLKAVPNLENYDTILIGGPVWNGIAANPLLKYLETTDLGGKKVSAFYTAASSVGDYENDFTSRVKNGNIVKGLGLLSNQLTNNKLIEDWIKTL